MASGIVAKNGVIEIADFLSKNFVGSSGAGKFPPIGHRYETFTCQPKRGESGILVFSDRMVENDYLSFAQYWWEGEKVIMIWNIKRSKRIFSYSKEAGFVVRIGDQLYVTKIPNERGPEDNYCLVDLFVMLKYLEGKIELKELFANAKSCERRAQHQVRFSQLSDKLEIVTRAAALQAKVQVELEDAYRQLSQKHLLLTMKSTRQQVVIELLDGLLEFFERWPVWLRPRCIKPALYQRAELQKFCTDNNLRPF